MSNVRGGNSQGRKCDHRLTTDREKRCKKPAGARTEHPGYGYCSVHGGQLPQNIRKAVEMEIRDKATRAVQLLGVPVETSPEEALLKELMRASGLVEWLEAEIRRLPVDEDGNIVMDVEVLVDPHDPRKGFVTQQQTVPAVIALSLDAKLGGVMKTYLAERQHLSRVSKMAIDARLAERQTFLSEQRTALLFTALSAVLKDLGHDPNSNDVRKVVHRRLRALSAADEDVA